MKSDSMQKRISQFVLLIEVIIIFILHAVKINQENKNSSNTSQRHIPIQKATSSAHFTKFHIK